jgi:hypothetical protein
LGPCHIPRCHDHGNDPDDHAGRRTCTTQPRRRIIRRLTPVIFCSAFFAEIIAARRWFVRWIAPFTVVSIDQTVFFPSDDPAVNPDPGLDSKHLRRLALEFIG